MLSGQPFLVTQPTIHPPPPPLHDPIHSPFLLLRLEPAAGPRFYTTFPPPCALPHSFSLRLAYLSHPPQSHPLFSCHPSPPHVPAAVQGKNNGFSFDRSSARRRQIELEICDSAVCKVVRLFFSSEVPRLLLFPPAFLPLFSREIPSLLTPGLKTASRAFGRLAFMWRGVY